MVATPKTLGLDGLAPCFGGSTLSRAEPGGELCAADAELAVDVGEVGLDRAQPHVQLGGDLLVRAALGGELGDPPFRLGQLLRGGGASADPAQLGTRPLRPQGGAEILEGSKGLVELLTRCALLLGLPAHVAECEERSGALHRPGRGRPFRDGVREGGQATRAS